MTYVCFLYPEDKTASFEILFMCQRPKYVFGAGWESENVCILTFSFADLCS